MKNNKKFLKNDQDTPHPKDKEEKIVRQKDKDAKLAETLRANLRKRKEQKKQWEKQKKDAPSTKNPV